MTDALPADEQLHILGSGVADIVPLEALRAKLGAGRSLIAKLGVDPTAPDLHLGHAVPLRKLRQFQDLGHRVVLIIGDFTALIGDPSGRDSTRPPLTPEQVDANAATYIEQAFHILDPDLTTLRRNSEWLAPLDFAEIIRLTGRFTVARILERDDFQKRYREGLGISLHEFLYPLAQAYDSVAIKADVELGGTDQLFNLLAGRELMEKEGMEPQVCLTLPLLEGTDGVQKMSKSYGNYVGLTDKPAEMFGKIMSIPDAIMPKYYRLCTALPVDEVDRVERGLSDGSIHPNEAKRRLGRLVVELYHGEDASIEAECAFDRLFKAKEVPSDLTEFPADLSGEVFLPALLKDAGLVSTNGEGRRMISGGGVRIDGQQVDPSALSVDGELLSGVVLQAGKRRFVRIVPKSSS